MDSAYARAVSISAGLGMAGIRRGLCQLPGRLVQLDTLSSYHPSFTGDPACSHSLLFADGPGRCTEPENNTQTCFSAPGCPFRLSRTVDNC